MNRLALAVLVVAVCKTPVNADGDGGGVTAEELAEQVSKNTPMRGQCDTRLRDGVARAILAGSGGAKAQSSHAWDHKGAVEYYDRVLAALALSDDEQRQLVRDGMVVPARLEYDTYASAYYDIHRAQLPIFVSADSIMHAVYASHDHLLADLERDVLWQRLDHALERMHGALAAAAKDYPQDVAEDLDLYLFVARKLLDDNDQVQPQLGKDVAARAENVLTLINYDNKLTEIELFGRRRAFDASVYAPRGHYKDDTALERYFRAAMWLSRMEWNLVSLDTRSSTPGWTPDPRETPREAVDALAFADLAERSGALADLAAIDQAWASFAGTREDVSLSELNALRKQAGIKKLVVPESANKLREAIGARYARSVNVFPNPNVHRLPVIATAIGPRITADTIALGASPASTEPSEAAAAVAYMLGNDRALAYTGKLERAGLDAARTALVRSKPHDDLYGAWLDAIRALSHPVKGAQPAFATTAGYRDLRLDTTLAAYGQLRHNHVLIAAKIYDVGGCEIPDGYVEPVPETYDALARWAKDGGRVFATLDPKHATTAAKYFGRVEQVMTLLAAISRHELANKTLTTDEKRFLAMAVEMREASAWGYNGTFPLPTYDGWYIDLFPNMDTAFHSASFIVDYATHDRQDLGKWVDYLGARGPHLGLFVVDSNGAPRLMVGPIASAFAANGPIAKLYDDDTLDQAAASMPWAASYTAAAPPAPHLTISAVRTPPGAKPDPKHPHRGPGVVRTDGRVYLDDDTLAFESDRDLGDVTIELRDHHFVKLDTMTVHVGKGHTDAKLKRNEAVESLLVRAGAFSGRLDFDLEGYATRTFGGKP